MSKKVLIISSSPRKGGNSDILCDAFVGGMVCADGVYEKGTVNDTKFVAEIKKLGKGIK